MSVPGFRLRSAAITWYRTDVIDGLAGQYIDADLEQLGLCVPKAMCHTRSPKRMFNSSL